MARRPFDIEREFARKMRKLRKAFIKRSGYVILEGLEDRFTPEARAEWLAAIEEYERLEKQSKPN